MLFPHQDKSNFFWGGGGGGGLIKFAAFGVELLFAAYGCIVTVAL